MIKKQASRILLCKTLFINILLSSPVAGATQLQWLTEHSPPGQYLDEQGKLSGVTVALIRELQQRLDEPADIQLLPWGRAMMMAKTEPNTALFETVRTPERDSWFKWVGPLMHYHINLYGLRQRLGVNANTLALPGKLIACSYRNAATVNDIKAFGFVEGRNLILTSQTGECLDMLIAGRIDVVAITEYSLPAYAARVQAAGFELTTVHYLTERKRYIAFSNDVADERITAWQQALMQSYRDGTMRKLYQRAYSEAMINRLEQTAQAQQR